MRIALAGILTITSLSAQTPQAFEVASIRLAPPVKAGELVGSGFRVAGNNLVGERVTVESLIGYAYNVPSGQLSSLPSWGKSDRWNILAKGPGTSAYTEQQMRSMLQALMADRFQLALGKEVKETSVYRLVVAPGGSKLGPAIDPADATVPAARRVARGDGVLEWAKGKQSLRSLIGIISTADRRIVNMTGLPDAGTYVFAFQFVPDNLLTAPNAPAGPSAFKAIEDQLGLKLEQGKLPLEYYTVERVEKPSEN